MFLLRWVGLGSGALRVGRVRPLCREGEGLRGTASFRPESCVQVILKEGDPSAQPRPRSGRTQLWKLTPRLLNLGCPLGWGLCMPGGRGDRYPPRHPCTRRRAFLLSPTQGLHKDR